LFPSHDHAGKRESHTEIGRIGGESVYRVNRFDKDLRGSDVTLAVGVQGKGDRRMVVATYDTKQGALGTRPSHYQLVDKVGGDLDNYVRMTEGKLPNGTRGILVDRMTAASVDPEKGINNIYKALDILHSRGVPKDMPVFIFDRFDPKFGIETTVKSWENSTNRLIYERKELLQGLANYNHETAVPAPIG